MMESTKAWLEYTAKVLHEQTRSESDEVWWIMTAMRGPDEPEAVFLKERVTEKIRWAAFGSIAPAAASPGKIPIRDFQGEGFYLKHSHFRGHSLHAAEILGVIDDA